MITQDTKKKAVIALRAMFKNAKSISEIEIVRYKCKVNKVKYFILSDMSDSTFKRAMEFNQVEDFYI